VANKYSYKKGRQKLKRTNPLYKDIKEFNILFLILIGLVLVGISGFSSYAYFTSEVTSPNEIRGVVKEPIKTGTDTLISKVGAGGLVKEDHPATFQLQATTAYRYTGKNPANYINFNNETWRIIGVFETDDGSNTSGQGKLEKRIKIIRDSIGKIKYSSYENDWNKASLMTLLNSGDYYNRTGSYTTNGLTNEAKSQITDSKWYLGGDINYNGSKHTTSYLYNIERGENVYSGNSTNWIGKVGLMYPSDYGYATSGNQVAREECLNLSLKDWDATNYIACRTNDWLFNSSYIQAMISPNSSENTRIFAVTTTGTVDNSYLTYQANYIIRPTVYLKPDIKLTGEGTSTSPYEIATK